MKEQQTILSSWLSLLFHIFSKKHSLTSSICIDGSFCFASCRVAFKEPIPSPINIYITNDCLLLAHIKKWYNKIETYIVSFHHDFQTYHVDKSSLTWRLIIKNIRAVQFLVLITKHKVNISQHSPTPIIVKNNIKITNMWIIIFYSTICILLL